MTYEELNAEIIALGELPGIELFVMGYSTLGQPIYAVHLGNYEGKQIIIEGGIHAREYPASFVVIGMIKYLREIAYLRPRNNMFSAVFRVRSEAAFAIHEYFNQNCFV